jgi:putative ABC transport system substrate-binding protein
MRRRDFIALLATAAAWPGTAFAESPARTYRIGTLVSAAPMTDTSPFGAPLVRALAQRGYVQGRNLVFERRGAEGRIERLPQLVKDLAASKVDVIFTASYPAAVAAKQAGTIPTVVFGAGDPVGTGLVESLARPGGNLTGLSDVSEELTPKRMELLKQIAPAIRRVAMLWNAGDLGMTLRYRASHAGAQAIGLQVQPLGVREPDDFEQAFAAMNRDRPDAILLVADRLTNLNRKRVFEFAAAHRLPAMFEYDWLVREGGLISYGPDLDDGFARIAALIERILKGAKPAELPFEQPTRFKLAINIKAAKALGLEIPATLLARADEVVE